MSLHSTDSSVGCTAKIENIGIYLSDVEEGGTRWKVTPRDRSPTVVPTKDRRLSEIFSLSSVRRGPGLGVVEGGRPEAREWPISSRHFSTKSSRHFSISSRHYRTTFLPAIFVFEEFVCLLPNLESDAKPRTH